VLWGRNDFWNWKHIFSSIWQEIFAGQNFHSFRLDLPQTTKILTVRINHNVNHTFTCIRCGWLLEFGSFACIVRWQCIFILVAWRRYWAYWLLFIEVLSSSIVLAMLEVSVGNGKQGHYVSCHPMSRHGFTILWYKTWYPCRGTFHHFNTKFACHHNCAFHWNNIYGCGLAIVKPWKFFCKIFANDLSAKILPYRITAHRLVCIAICATVISQRV